MIGLHLLSKVVILGRFDALTLLKGRDIHCIQQTTIRNQHQSPIKRI